MKIIRIYSCGECPYCRSKTIRNSRRHTTRYCTLIKQYIKGQSIPVECTLKEVYFNNYLIAVCCTKEEAIEYINKVKKNCEGMKPNGAIYEEYIS